MPSQSPAPLSLQEIQVAILALALLKFILGVNRKTPELGRLVSSIFDLLSPLLCLVALSQLDFLTPSAYAATSSKQSWRSISSG